MKTLWNNFFKIWEQSPPFVRIVLIPSLITSLIVGRQYYSSIIPAWFTVSLIIALSFLQSFLAYWETRVTERLANQAKTFRELNEALKIRIERKSRRLADGMALDRPGHAPLVPELTKRADFLDNASIITDALHNIMVQHIRRRKGFESANIVTALLAPNEDGGFDLLCHVSCATSGNLEARVRNLRVADQDSLACVLMNGEVANMISASNVQKLQRKKMFKVFNDLNEYKFLKSIIGFRVDVELGHKYLWTIDSDIENSFPDSDDKRSDESFQRLNEIIAAFAERLRHEHLLVKAAMIGERGGRTAGGGPPTAPHHCA